MRIVRHSPRVVAASFLIAIATHCAQAQDDHKPGGLSKSLKDTTFNGRP